MIGVATGVLNHWRPRLQSLPGHIFQARHVIVGEIRAAAGKKGVVMVEWLRPDIEWGNRGGLSHMEVPGMGEYSAIRGRTPLRLTTPYGIGHFIGSLARQPAKAGRPRYHPPKIPPQKGAPPPLDTSRY